MHQHKSDSHPPTGYSRSCPASPGCGSNQGHGKAEKDEIGCAGIDNLSNTTRKAEKDEKGCSGRNNLPSHLVQHETLKPFSKASTEWIVELQCHGCGSLQKKSFLHQLKVKLA